MTALRTRFIEDMQLHGYSPKTQTQESSMKRIALITLSVVLASLIIGQPKAAEEKRRNDEQIITRRVVPPAASHRLMAHAVAGRCCLGLGRSFFP